VYDRHFHFLTADGVQLLSDDLLDPLVHSEAQWEQGVDARTEPADIAGSDQETVRRHVRVGRIVAKRDEEELR
jgi:hypothetical protein